jgi:threonine synthase
MGATTKDKDSKLEKLFSYFLPSFPKIKRYIDELRKDKIVGDKTAIHTVNEKYVDEAMKLASDQQIRCEPSGIAGLALLLQLKKTIPKDSKILIVNTGKTNYNPMVPMLSR